MVKVLSITYMITQEIPVRLQTPPGTELRLGCEQIQKPVIRQTIFRTNFTRNRLSGNRRSPVIVTESRKLFIMKR
jgi:hypothetical protein